MPIFRLDRDLWFPPPELADDGILAVGGDLRPERLLLAYRSGIFPWYHDGLPILWHSPDPREILDARKLHVPRSLKKRMRACPFDVRLDTAFARVIEACAETPRPDQDGTWITEDMKGAYLRLHELGFAHSIESWRGDVLAGGLYGVSLGAVFFGESMFAHEEDASKIAFVTIAEALRGWGIHLIDCQVHTEHLARFGSESWPRARYLASLAEALRRPTRPGPWRLDTP